MMMKHFILLITILLPWSVYSADSSHLDGNVPEDIFIEMEHRNCTVIKGFYSLARSEGGGRIGSPFDDGYTLFRPQTDKH